MLKKTMTKEVIKRKAYLYIIWCGELRVYEGDVTGTFRYDGVFITEERSIACYSEPKVVYNGVVWLPEKNENLAKALLIQYEEAEIAILKEKIEVKTNIINVLKGDK